MNAANDVNEKLLFGINHGALAVHYSDLTSVIVIKDGGIRGIKGC